MRSDDWSLLRTRLKGEWGIAREGDDWVGIYAGAARISIAVGRVGSLVELIAGVCRVAQVAPIRLLELARRLEAGGLVIEAGTYLLKEVLPLDGRAGETVPAAIRRLATETARLRMAALPRAATPHDLFDNYV